MTGYLRYLSLVLVALATPVLIYGWHVGLLSGWWSLASGLLLLLGLHDLTQTGHSILRNYPILGHLRFLLETVRPEIRQYLLESETDAVPFSRLQRATVYQRAKQALDKRPFGT